MQSNHGKLVADQFPLRLPEGLRFKIRENAKENLRSMNAEIIFQLQQIYAPETKKADATA